MYLIKAGKIEIEGSVPLAQQGQSHDFEKAKTLAIKLLKKYDQVEVIDAKTGDCVYFQTKEAAPPKELLIKK